MCCRSSPPSWQGTIGNQLYWTNDRIVCALVALADSGPLPPTYPDYQRLKAHRANLPSARHVSAYGGGGHGSFRRAYERAGVQKAASLKGAHWTQREIAFLLTNAGVLSLHDIEIHLRRAPRAAYEKLQQLGVRARDNQGDYTVQQLAQHLKISLHRVYDAVRTGRLAGTKRNGYWQIAPADIAMSLAWLTRPKETHTSTPPRYEDYYQVNNLRRNVAGKIIGRRVPRHAAAPQ